MPLSSLKEITQEDLQNLIANEVMESKTIEYKQKLPNPDKGGNVKFLKQVASFANTSGGELVYGIKEDGKGLPKELVGLVEDDIDGEKLRLEQLMQSQIEPRIPEVHIEPVKLDNSKYVIVIRVRKSWVSPHRVKINNKFYARHSSGVYDLDVSELRTAFNLSESIAERIRNFRVDRIAKIRGGETPVPLKGGAKAVLHLIPLQAMTSGEHLDIMKMIDHRYDLEIIRCASGSRDLNLDGVVTFTNRGAPSEGYTQLYRNGIVEAVCLASSQGNDKNAIPNTVFEKSIIKALKSYLDILTILEVRPPMYLFLALLDVKGYVCVMKSIDDSGSAKSFTQDIISLPEQIIDSLDSKPADILKPLFDMIWNAAGSEKSLNYNEDGEWVD